MRFRPARENPRSLVDSADLPRNKRILERHACCSEAGVPYDAVIVASPVRAGRYQRDVRRWVKTHAATLDRRHTAFVSVCLSVLDKRESTRAALARMLEEFVKETGWRPTVVKVVPSPFCNPL